MWINSKKNLHQTSNVANWTTRVCAFLVFQNTMQYEIQCRLFTDHFCSFSCIVILVKSIRTMITYYCSHCIILCGLRTLQLHHCSTFFLSLNCITLKNKCFSSCGAMYVFVVKPNRQMHWLISKVFVLKKYGRPLSVQRRTCQNLNFFLAAKLQV